MRCSSHLHWLLAAWGEGTDRVCAPEIQRACGMGADWVRVSKVLQVTVQVKRQILSAVWRKALKVPTVQRERSSLSGTQGSGSFKEKLDDCSALSTSEHAPTDREEEDPPQTRTKRDVFWIRSSFLHVQTAFFFLFFSFLKQTFIRQHCGQTCSCDTFLSFSLQGSSEWRQFVQLMLKKQVLCQICQFRSKRVRMIWKKDTCNSSRCSRTNTCPPPTDRCTQTTPHQRPGLQPCLWYC